jgi:DNA-binding transcriptional MerR regulator
MSEKQLLQAIAVTAEMTGTQLSPAASRAMFEDLRRYPEHQVLLALMACRRQLQHRLTLADIIARIDDGRPGPEEAWATVVQTQSEYVTVVWTEEMRLAAGIAHPLLQQGDTVAARMAFLESYKKLVQQERDEGKPVQWTVSLGRDRSGRDGPIREAVMKGRLTLDQVGDLLPPRLDYVPQQLQAGLKRIAEKQP